MVEPAQLPPPAAGRPAGSSILTAGGVVLAIGGLYFGQDIFVPFALAILLSFALSPLVNWLRRRRLPRIAAVLLAVGLAVVVIAGVATIVGRQLVQLADNLPTYQTTLTQKIRSLQNAAPGGGVVEKVTTTIEQLGSELSGDNGDDQAPAASPLAPREPEPVLVRLETPKAEPLEIIQAIVGPLIAPIATAGLVVIFVIFVLLEREDLRDRFIKLAGAGDLQKSTQAINDAAARVSRYLLMQLVVNASYGIPVGIALQVIGVPNAILWGLLAAVLRFIPYLGPFLAALFPAALAVAVDPGWSMLAWVVGVFLVAELISNNVIEPWLYGSSTGLSSLAIIMAAIFWTSLWGPVGLFLATPLTVCLVVIGRYVPQLEFLGVMLGSDPVLAPEERLYQRLLAGNLEEAVEIAETYVEENSAVAFYDNVAIPALRLAENDRQRSTSDTGYRWQVAETAICVVREIEDARRELDEGSPPGPGSAPEEPGDGRPEILCLAGRTELDHAAAEMMAEAFAERARAARVLPPIAVSQGALGQLDLKGVRVVCLSYLHPQPQVYARYICRRIRRRAPAVKLVVCCWNLQAEAGPIDDLRRQMAADGVFASLAGCLDQVAAWVGGPPADHAPAAADDGDESRASAMHDLGLDRLHAPELEEAAGRIARSFDVPIALVTFLDAHHEALGATAHPGREALAQARSHEDTLGAHVVAANAVLVSADATRDPRFSEDPYVLEKGIRFFAGAPLRTPSGMAVGSVRLIDTRPRDFSADEGERLQREADDLMARLGRLRPASAVDGAA